MKRLFPAIALLGILAIPGIGETANGTVQMTWDTCTGPIDKLIAQPIPIDLFVSELGSDRFHRAYQVRIIYGNAADQVPDAWRFDPAGCPTNVLITIDQLPSAALAKTCPAFQQNRQSLQIKNADLVPPADPYPQTMMRLILANAYPAGATALPTTRYFLAGFRFDHTFSVDGPTTPGKTCGGFEQPMCFKLVTATYLDANDNEIPFDQATPQMVSFLGASVCPANPVPARPATWGSIKGQYRR